MKLETIKVGMKVKLLGKHAGGDDYDNIDDWYKDCEEFKDVNNIQQQGYGIVNSVVSEEITIICDTLENYHVWTFTALDLAPYKEPLFKVGDRVKCANLLELVENTKTPKEWLCTRFVIATTRDGDKFTVINNEHTPMLEDYGRDNFSFDLEHDFDEELKDVDDYPPNDIMKLEYEGKVVWEREEVKEMTLAEIEEILGYKVKIK